MLGGRTAHFGFCLQSRTDFGPARVSVQAATVLYSQLDAPYSRRFALRHTGNWGRYGGSDTTCTTAGTAFHRAAHPDRPGAPGIGEASSSMWGAASSVAALRLFPARGLGPGCSSPVPPDLLATTARPYHVDRSLGAGAPPKELNTPSHPVGQNAEEYGLVCSGARRHRGLWPPTPLGQGGGFEPCFKAHRGGRDPRTDRNPANDRRGR